MKKSVILLGLILSSGFLTHSRAADVPLTWDACAKEALAHNPDLQKAADNLQSAKYGKKGAVSPFLPSLSADASTNRSGNEGSVAGILKNGDSNPTYQMGLNASINLFNGFKDKASFDLASIAEQQAGVQYQQARATLSNSLRNAFNNLLYSQQQVTLLQEIADREKENVRMVELNYQGGQENKGSLLNEQATSADADIQVTQAKRSLWLAQSQLDVVLGRSELDTPVVAGTFDTTTPDAAPDFKALCHSTFSYLLAVLQLRTAQAQVVSARGSFFPSLNANGSMSRSGSDWVPNQPSWGAGLSLSFPLFEGGQRVFSFESAKASRDAAKVALTSAELNAALSLENAYWAFRDATEATLVQNKYLEAAKLQEEVANAQYANGLLTYQDWNLVENSLITRQKSNLQTLLAAKTAEASWIQTLGKDELP
jgi:outer membrane protein TolC